MSRLPHQKRILIEALEPRLLFSATADIAVFDDGNSDALQLSEAAAKLDLVAVYMQPSDSLTDSDTALFPSATETSSPIITTLVFVDAAVENHEALVEGIRQQHQTGSIEIIYLDANTDGVAQITEKLTGFSQLDSLHIISHSAPGSVALGNALLSVNNLFNYEDELIAWRAALGEDADILIYGCDIAATTEGQRLIAQIAALTDADVAASDDATGHSSLNGDWELEFAVGDIEHNVLVSAAVQDTWVNVLAANHYINIQGGNIPQSVSSAIAVGQSFLFDSPDPTYTVNQISVQLRLESGAANQDITIQLLDGGWNDASPLAAQTINSSQLGESFGWKTFNFGDVTLNKNQTYILKITTTNADGKVFVAYNSNVWNNAEMIVNGAGNSSADLNFLLSYNDGNNQPPVNLVPGAQSTSQNTALIFNTTNNNRIQISDPDAFPNDVQVTLSVLQGKLTLAQTTGLTFLSGDNSGSYSYLTVRGTESAVNAALATITYTPSVNVVGPDTLSITTKDLGLNGVEVTDDIAITINNINDAPTGTDKTISVNEDTTYVFTVADFGFSDSNDTPAHNLFGVRIASLVTAGTLTLNGNSVTLGQTISVTDITGGLLVFAPAANANGAGYSSFTFQVQDDGGTANGGVDLDQSANTITFDVTAVNDAPVVANPLMDQTTDEEAAFNYTFPIDAFSDVDGDLLIYSATLANNDSLPAWLHFDQATRTFSGVPDDGDVGTITVRVIASDGNGQSVSDTFDITVNNVNDLPFLHQPIVDQAALEDTFFSFIFDANTFGDGDLDAVFSYTAELQDGSELPAWLNFNAATRTFSGTPGNNDVGTISIRLIVDDGAGETASDIFDIVVANINDAPSGTDKTISLDEDGSYTLSTADFGFSDTNDNPANILLAVKIASLPTAGSLTLNGVAVTLGQTISVADIVGGLLVFTPAANASGASYSSFTFQVQDDGGTANGGVDLDQSANTITFDVTSVNDAPAGTDKTISLNEDGSYTLSTADFGFSDTNDNPANILLAVKIASLPTAGSLTLNGVAVILNQTIAAADINSGLLVFTPVANANGASYSSFTFQVQDDGGTVNGGVDLDQSGNTITFDVTSINDAPAGADKTISLNEDGSYTLSSADFGFSDSNDSPANNLYGVRIASLATAGSLTLNGVAVILNQTITVADINSGLLVFTPVANANGAGYSSFTFQVQDDGGTANGGVDLDQSANTITFDVTSVNDAPAGTDKAISLNEDGSYALSSADFGFSDTNDSPANNLYGVRIASLATAGSLSLNGVAVILNQTITVADINSGLLVFTPTANASGASYSSFTFQVQDDGGTANGGVDFDQSANAITFDVTSINDAPAGTDQTISLNEDDSYILSSADFGFSDSNDSQANNLYGVRIASLATAGSLTLNGVAVTLGQSISVADIVGGLLVFTPEANANGAGYSSFTFQVQDDGGTASGGVDLDQSANTITFDITSINDAPAGTDKTISLNEDGSYTLSSADFGFSDTNDNPANNLLGVRIASLATAGTLTLDGNVVTLGQTITVADINSGLLVFTPVANANGASYSSFTFQVQDDGTTTNGGVDLDQSANTITFDVTSVNDAPAGTDKTISLNEDGSYTLSTADFGFSDTNDNPANILLAVKIASLPMAGSLTLNGVAVTLGQAISVADIVGGLLVFTPAANANGVGYSSFTFQVQDDGGTANGGVDLDQGGNTITFDVTSINDAPAGADKTISLNEDGSYTLSSADFGFSDSNDSPANNLYGVRIASLATAGSLTLNGVAVILNQTITVADINSGLLVFTPAANANGASYSSFTFQVQDDGGTVNGGVDLDPSANTITFDVTGVNDAPAGTDKTISFNEDAAYVLTVADFGFSDSNDSPANSLLGVRIASLATAGTLTLDGNAVTLGQTIAIADINSGLLVFTPAANANGASYSSFTFQVQDDGGSANGGVDVDPSANTLTFNVTAVNDAPTVVNLIPDQNATEDALFDYQVNSDVFDDVDVGDMLTYSAQLAGGSALPVWLSFDSATHSFSGTPANGDLGVLLIDVTADDGKGGSVTTTFTLNVANANDAPAGADNIINLDEDGSYVLTVADFGFSDPNDSPENNLLAVKIASLPTAGRLTLDGVAVTLNQFIAVADITSGLLVFTPAENANGIGYSSFTFQVQDDGGTASGGVDLDQSANTLTFNVTAINDAPTVANPIADQHAIENSAFNYQFNSNVFADVDVGDVLTYSVQLAGGGALPGWLSFDAATRTFSGTPANDDVGTLTIVVTATDLSGEFVNDTFTLTIGNTNDVPTVANPIPDQNVTEDSLFSFQFASDTFDDIDAGDTLTYTALLSGGGALPAWLIFDAVTRTFSGAPATADIGVLSIDVIADDAHGGTVTDTFTITIASAPDTEYIDTGNGNNFNPVSSSNQLGQSFSYDSAAATYTVNEISLYLARYDHAALQTITVELRDSWNGAILASNSIPSSQISRDGFGWHSFSFNDVVLNDQQTYVIQISSSGTDDLVLVSRFSSNVYDDGALIENGIPHPSGWDLAFKVSKDDGLNTAPILDNPIADQTIDAELPFNLVVPLNTFSDPDVNDTITYRAQLAGGGSLGWLTFNEASRTFAGTPHWHQAGTITVELIATDNHGASTSSFFDIEVINTNTPPTVVNPIPDLIIDEDATFNFQFAANTFGDVDTSNTFTYSAQLAVFGGMPPWLGFDSATRTFFGTPANGDVGTWTVEVTANDGFGGTVIDTFNIVVANTNDAPTVANPIANQAATEDVLFNFQFNSNVFVGTDVGDTLTYSAQLAGGGALPAWLGFDAATRTFSGTPTNADVGVLSIDVIADDGNGGSATDTFVLTIVNVNDAPLVTNAIPDQNATQDVAFNFQLASNTFTDLDVGDTLSYSVQVAGGALPAWLTFDYVTGAFSGTPTNADVGVLTIVVTATDSSGESVNDTFTLTISNVNDAPTVANPIANQTATEDVPFNFQFNSNTFNDIDVGDTLSYFVQVAGGGALPDWLGFDAATQTFSGTPANGDVGTVSIEVIANDGNGGSVVNTFTITVINVNDAPVAGAIASINNIEDAAGDTLNLWSVFSDAESSSQELIYSVVSNSNPGLFSTITVNTQTGELQLNYAANQFGSAELIIRAQDPQGAMVEALLVVNIAPVNDVPEAIRINDMSVVAGSAPSQIDLRTKFIDIEDGTSLSYELMGNSNPEAVVSVQMDPDTGLMTFTISSQNAGESIIRLRALDSEGAWVESSFKVVVSAKEPVTPPEVIPPETVEPTSPVRPDPVEPPIVVPPIVAPPITTPPETGLPNPTPPTNGDGASLLPLVPAEPEATIFPPDRSLLINAETEESGHNLQADKSAQDYERIAETLNRNTLQVSTLTASTSLVSLIEPDAGFAPWEAAEFDSEVRRIRAQMDEALDEEHNRKAVIAGISFSLTTGLLIWSLRASSLLLAMISMLPLWRGLDPLPILDEVNKRKKELEQQRKDRKHEDKNAKEVGYLFDHAQQKGKEN